MSDFQKTPAPSCAPMHCPNCQDYRAALERLVAACCERIEDTCHCDICNSWRAAEAVLDGEDEETTIGRRLSESAAEKARTQ